MKKIINVSMAITFDGTEDEFIDIQRILDHHIEYLMSLDEYQRLNMYLQIFQVFMTWNNE